MKPTLTIIRLLATFFVFTIITQASCTKETSGGGPGATNEEEFASRASSEADAESEIVFNEIFDDVMGVNNEVGMAGTGVFGKANLSSNNDVSAREQACPEVSVTHLDPLNNFPVKIVLDFGAGCVGRDGHTRSGKIIVTYTKRLIVPGAKATTTFDNFKFDEIKVEGTHEITNLNTITSTDFIHKWKVVVEGGKLTKPNGNYSEWSSIKTITQIEGSGTPYIPLDDIYKIEGSAGGKVKRGDILVGWKTEIIEPLIKKFTCRWIVKGAIKVVRLNLNSSSQWVAVLNYGGGTCDNKALVTINGLPHEITLP